MFVGSSKPVKHGDLSDLILRALIEALKIDGKDAALIEESR